MKMFNNLNMRLILALMIGTIIAWNVMTPEQVSASNDVGGDDLDCFECTHCEADECSEHHSSCESNVDYLCIGEDAAPGVSIDCWWEMSEPFYFPCDGPEDNCSVLYCLGCTGYPPVYD